MSKFCLILTLILTISITATTLSKAEINGFSVVTTIAPVHSIVSSITKGVVEPHLIIKGAGNPHNHSLRPSDAKALARAKLVFWIGPDLEGFLKSSLKHLSVEAEIITLSLAPDILLLPSRANEDHDEDHNSEGHSHNDDEMDMHIWLSPQNAVFMANFILNKLIEKDPSNKDIYLKNHKQLSSDLYVLDEEIKNALSSVHSSAFLTFHDSFQYFEDRYKLNHMGTINLNPNAPVGAKKLSELRQEITTTTPACIFTEPQYNSHIISVLTEDLNIPTNIIDPLGIDLKAGPDLYFDLMRRNTKSILNCLSQ